MWKLDRTYSKTYFLRIFFHNLVSSSLYLIYTQFCQNQFQNMEFYLILFWLRRTRNGKYFNLSKICQKFKMRQASFFSEFVFQNLVNTSSFQLLLKCHFGKSKLYKIDLILIGQVLIKICQPNLLKTYILNICFLNHNHKQFRKMTII